METNDLYIGIMYAKSKDIRKIIRMFLVSPIKEYTIFSSKPIIKGFKEAVTNTVLTKGLSNRYINNRNIIWEISNKKAASIISNGEIDKYINMSKEEIKMILNDSINEAEEIIKMNHIKIKTK